MATMSDTAIAFIDAVPVLFSVSDPYVDLSELPRQVQQQYGEDNHPNDRGAAHPVDLRCPALNAPHPSSPSLCMRSSPQKEQKGDPLILLMEVTREWYEARKDRVAASLQANAASVVNEMAPPPLPPPNSVNREADVERYWEWALQCLHQRVAAGVTVLPAFPHVLLYPTYRPTSSPLITSDASNTKKKKRLHRSASGPLTSTSSSGKGGGSSGAGHYPPQQPSSSPLPIPPSPQARVPSVSDSGSPPPPQRRVMVRLRPFSHYLTIAFRPVSYYREAGPWIDQRHDPTLAVSVPASTTVTATTGGGGQERGQAEAVAEEIFSASKAVIQEEGPETGVGGGEAAGAEGGVDGVNAPLFFSSSSSPALLPEWAKEELMGFFTFQFTREALEDDNDDDSDNVDDDDDDDDDAEKGEVEKKDESNAVERVDEESGNGSSRKRKRSPVETKTKEKGKKRINNPNRSKNRRAQCEEGESDGEHEEENDNATRMMRSAPSIGRTIEAYKALPANVRAFYQSPVAWSKLEHCLHYKRNTASRVLLQQQMSALNPQ